MNLGAGGKSWLIWLIVNVLDCAIVLSKLRTRSTQCDSKVRQAKEDGEGCYVMPRLHTCAFFMFAQSGSVGLLKK